jgi:hypothetical protein
MRFSLLFVLCIFSALFMQSTFAAIDLSVTPIRYEITADPGDTITKTAKIINNTNSAFTIIMGKSDFQAKDTT